MARLVRTTPAVMELLKADAARREPQHRPPLVVRRDGALGLWHLATQRFTQWRRGTGVLAIRPVVSSLWTAAQALCHAGAPAGTRGTQAKPTARRRGRGGSVLGGRRQRLATRRRRTAVRETRATVLRWFHTHRRGMPSAADLAAGGPRGTGVVESACGAVVQHRLEGAGKRWRLEGAEAMRAVRSRKKSPDADLRADGPCRARQVRVRLDGGQPQDTPPPGLRPAASLHSIRSRSFDMFPYVN